MSKVARSRGKFPQPRTIFLGTFLREDLAEAERFVKLLYAEVLYLYEKRIAAVEAAGTVRPESMGLAARIQHTIAREKAR